MMAKAEEQKVESPVKDETPSMEEILQSIRGVISGEEDNGDVLELTEIVEEVSPATQEKPAEDTSGKSILDDIDDALGGAAPATQAAPEPQPEEAKAAEVQEAPAIVEPEKTEDIPPPVQEKIMEEPVAKSEEKTPVIENTGAEMAETDDILEIDVPEVKESSKKASPADRLLDDEVARQSSVPLRELVHSVHDKHVHSPNTRSGTSLEDLVIEAMKPFLADWLNKNLPAIVKKIVEKEVKHIIPKEED